MQVYKLIIPGEMPTLNEIIDAAKSHWAEYSRMKSDFTNLVALVAKKLPELDRVYLEITYFRKNQRYDPDNIAAAKKFILDGLVAAGVLPNDGWAQVAGWSESWEVDKDNPRVEVIIKEV